MDKFLLPGRLSKVEENGVVIQIQTEFSWRPHPRIASTVSVGGAVIHKIQKDWEDPIETEEAKYSVEKFINRQHNEVVRIVDAQRHEFFPQPEKKKRSLEDILTELLALEGINGAWCITEKGIISPDSGGRELLPEYKGVFEGLIEICTLLSTTSSAGRLVNGEILLESDSLIILRKEERHFVLGYEEMYDPDVILSKVGKKLENV